MGIVSFDCISGRALINGYYKLIVTSFTEGYKFVCLLFITAVAVHDVRLEEDRQPLVEMEKINLVVNLLQQCTTLLQQIVNERKM